MSSTADDEREIIALIHEYAYRLDAGDLDGVAALFDRAELGSTRHDRRHRGAAEARTVYDGVILYDDGTPQTQHQITNVIVEVTGDAAGARSSFTVLQVTGQGLHAVLAGNYLDRFERAGGRWRFVERVFDPRLFGDLSRHMKRDREP
jgi:ketosteroid isomerase-like protein